MKTLAMLAAAGFAASAAAQDTTVTIEPTGNGDEWSITAVFSGDTSNVAGFTGIWNVWSEARFTLTSTDGVISGVDANDAYDNSPFPTDVTGDGTSSVRIDARSPGRPSANAANDSSNPLAVATFNYTGTAAGLSAALVDQNSITFTSTNPFADANELYQNAQGNPGSRSLEFVSFNPDHTPSLP
ncbi:MAG: hypothetical protein AAGB48_11165 [Planctomycetota bacterium]